mmetsp:Transcript_3821/g.6524  ORF Transcript_3821/g.6524 Transcript_3821/m.6524 type:complete len:83 (-) Transcript_3821:25-273(-)
MEDRTIQQKMQHGRHMSNSNSLPTRRMVLPRAVDAPCIKTREKKQQQQQQPFPIRPYPRDTKFHINRPESISTLYNKETNNS